MKTSLQIEEGKGLSFDEIQTHAKPKHYTPERYYDLIYTLKNFTIICTRIFRKSALFCNTIANFIQKLEENHANIASLCSQKRLPYSGTSI